MDERIKPREELENILESKRHNHVIVTTSGAFDLLHPGHIRTLKFAKSLGDILVVGLNTDESIRRYKPGRPIMPENDRAQMVAAVRYVDYVTLFNEDTASRFLASVRPNIHVKGSEYQADGRFLERAVVDAYGITVSYIAREQNDNSTSGIIARIIKQAGAPATTEHSR